MFALLSLTLALAPSPVTALAFNTDGTAVLLGLRSKAEVLRLKDGERLREMDGLTGRVTALAEADGKIIIAHGEAGTSGILRIGDIDHPAHKDAILSLSVHKNTIATASYDRTIKLWNLADLSKPVQTLTDHSDAVYAVAFSPDGTLLASASADRAVKVWDVATGKRLYTLGDSTDWVYTVAWSPDGKLLAAGGVDKSLRIWNVNRDGGKLVQSAFAHEKAILKVLFSPRGDRLYSLSEDRTAKFWDAKSLKEISTIATVPDGVHTMALSSDGSTLAIGRHDGIVQLYDAATAKPGAIVWPAKPAMPKTNDRFPPINETANNDSARTGMMVSLPVSIAGSLDRFGDCDFYRFNVDTPYELGLEFVAMDAKAKLEPVLTLLDASGATIEESTNGRLGRKLKPGTYSIQVRDRDYRGGSDYKYRLHAGPIPIVTGVSPLGVNAGKTSTVKLHGVNLPEATASVEVPTDAKPGSAIMLKLAPGTLGSASVVVNEFPTVSTLVAVPSTVDATLFEPVAIHRFNAKKGERIIVETHARRLGSPLDTTLELLDAKGAPVPQATLRATARTFVTFRDHDSVQGKIRLEFWNGIAIDDYLYVDSELMRMRDLPGHPDADAEFVTVAGKRRAYLGTTSTHHAQNAPMYKVEIHPPGTSFPSNGLPVFTLNHFNDDGGPGYDKDSRIVFDPPADGEYQIRLRDVRGTHGDACGYRLTERHPKPDFKIDVSPKALLVPHGGAMPLTITATRLDDFDGPIAIAFPHVTSGLAIPGTTIEAGQTSAVISVEWVGHDDTKASSKVTKLEASAIIEGKPVVRMIVLEPTIGSAQPDLIVKCANAEVPIKPGHETTIRVSIERRNGFKGRVPLDVRGLPHGVRVMNIGLNGVLITERETERDVVLYAEPWVKPLTIPFAIVGKMESKNGKESAAKSVMLKVE